MKATETGLKRILKAFTYSWSGFTASFKSEEAFRQDLLVCTILGGISFFLPVSGLEWVVLFFSLLFVLIMELVNTAIETLVDRISPEYHDLSKKAKDIGSLLVLLSFVNMMLSWGVILYGVFN